MTDALTSMVHDMSVPSVLDLTTVLEYAQRAVIHLKCTVRRPNAMRPFGRSEPRSVRGSGIFITPDGYFLTCAHVVSEAREVRCGIPTLSTTTSFPCDIVGICPENDAALCRVRPEELKDFLEQNPSLAAIAGWDPESDTISLPYIPLLSEGEENDLVHVGMQVIALGYPLGADTVKVNIGTLSGFSNGRIQTDATINAGNSGGPLCILNGEGVPRLLGLNAASLVGEGVQGIHYIVRSVDIRRVLPDMIDHEWISPHYRMHPKDTYIARVPFLGAMFVPPNDAGCSIEGRGRAIQRDLSHANGSKTSALAGVLRNLYGKKNETEQSSSSDSSAAVPKGAMLAFAAESFRDFYDVENRCPLLNGGMVIGDILMEFDHLPIDPLGKVVSNPFDDMSSISLDDFLVRYRRGQEVHIKFFSMVDRAVKDVSVKLTCVDPFPERFPMMDFQAFDHEMLGGLCVMHRSLNHQVQLSEIQNQFLTNVPDTRTFHSDWPFHTESKLMITYMQPNSPFDQHPMCFIGDEIVAVNGVPVKTLTEYREVVIAVVKDAVNLPLCQAGIRWKTGRGLEVTLSLETVLRVMDVGQSSYGIDLTSFGREIYRVLGLKELEEEETGSDVIVIVGDEGDGGEIL